MGREMKRQMKTFKEYCKDTIFTSEWLEFVDRTPDKLLKEGSLWDYMYKKNNAVFYRGESSSGKGMGFGMLGLGIYLTWSDSMAQKFADKQTRGVVQSFKVKRGLKMADNTSKEFASAMAALGRKPWEWSRNKQFSQFLTGELKQLGFEGAYSDNPAEGIVVFDAKNVKVVR